MSDLLFNIGLIMVGVLWALCILDVLFRLVYAWVEDEELSGHNRVFAMALKLLNGGYNKDTNEYVMFGDVDVFDEPEHTVLIIIAFLVLPLFAPVFIYWLLNIWPIVLLVAALIGGIFMLRMSRRHQKAMAKHMDDNSLHNTKS